MPLARLVRGSATDTPAQAAPVPEEVTPVQAATGLKRLTPIKATSPAVLSTLPQRKTELLEEVDFEFPTEKTQAKTRLEDCTILLYGLRKIGKTTIANEFPECLILAAEDGAGGIEAFAPRITSWMQFKSFVKKLATREDYHTIAMDVIDRLYVYCYEYVKARDGFNSPGDVPYGQGWGLAPTEFATVMDEFWAARKDRGLIMISHAMEKEFENWDGQTLNKIIPSSDRRALAYSAALTDIIIYYGYFGEQRLMCITGSDTLEAGQRLPKQFWVKGHGPDSDDPIRVHSIPAGDSAEEAYRNLRTAFYNEQTSSGDPNLDAVLIKPKKFKKKGE